tara:strand:+ start:5708 stop:6091 length:384 start_codon:yes stop_codon:yes gene_type:complete
MDDLFDRLERLLKNVDVKMTKDRYFDMMDQLGREPVEKDIPPDFEDLPQIAIDALEVYGRLGDRLVPDIGYLGKDFTLLQQYMELYLVDNKELFIEILLWLDQRSITKSAEKMQKEREKLKRKTSGK